MEGSEISEDFKSVGYAIKIKASLDKRLSLHVRALKHLEGRGYSKKRWIQEAIREKLKACQEIDIEKLESDSTLNFTISQYTNEAIVKIVKMLKKLKIQTSKTDFILDAIHEKLAKEEANTKNLFQNMLKMSSETSIVL